MSLNAFVTLLTTDAYLPGALVCIQSLLEAEGPNPTVPFETVCLVTPATVSVESIKALRRNFSLVVGVEELRSGSESNLALLGRQDLASTLTKLQLFRLIQFRKIIFLDADTLVLSPLSHLFSSEAPFSAAPDSGWPDCFNSGLFVCTPSAATFDGLMQLASERGSWDGGDQGLLNDYFHDWNRLSFTYNVTPSAYYTYAPAYRRYGDGIKVVHFIGSEKPWHQAGQRQLPSSSTTSSSSSSSASSNSIAKNEKAQHDYASLLDRWFGVYSRYFGSTNTNATFTFPTLQAVWDQASSNNSRAAYTPPSLESLKKQFQGVHDAHTVAMGGYKNNLNANNQQSGMRSLEGHYVSMPLSAGRPDLSGARVFIPKAEQITSATPDVSSQERVSSPPSQLPHVEILSPTPTKPEITFEHPSSSSPHHGQQQAEQQRSWSPQNVAWDPARSEPPKNDRPQMEGGFHYQADNVWDEPHSSRSSKSFFKAPTHYGSIPSITHQNYSQVARASPDQSKLKAVFPWEESSYSSTSPSTSAPYGFSSSSSAPRATRVFPPEQQREKLKLTPTRPAPPPPTGASNSPSSSRSNTPSNAQYHYDQHNQEHQHHHHGAPAHSGYDNQSHNHGAGHHHQQNAPSPVISDFANLSSAYGNAWDSVEGIRRYAKNLQGNGKGHNNKNANGAGKKSGSAVHQSRSSSSVSSASHGGSASSSSGHHVHAHSPSISSSHSRSASTQAGGGGGGSSSVSRMSAGSSSTNNGSNANDHARQRTMSANSTGSGYETGSEASSRDGDDEDDEEDGPLDRRPIKLRSTASSVSGASYNGRSPSSSAPVPLPSQAHYQHAPSSHAQVHSNNGPRFTPAARTSSSETITPQSSSSSYPGNGGTNLPDTSSGAYKPQRVSRVFDPSTATDVIRKEGLEALHRFVRSMEAKGAAANEAKNAAGAGANGNHGA